MSTRRQFFVQGAAIFGLAAHVAADEPRPGGKPDAPAATLVTPECEQAISRGLKFLASSQAQDGSFGSRNYRGDVAVTSLAGMAFLAGGHTPAGGPYSRVALQALEAVLAQQQDNPAGLLQNKRSSDSFAMYGHGYGTLFLA